MEKIPVQDDGEMISSMCFLHDGSLLLCREVMGITPSDIAQIALERWSSIGELLHSEEIRSRSVCLVADGTGAISGHFDGAVIKLSEDLSQQPLWKSMYTINDLRRHGEDLLVASWFYCIESMQMVKKFGDVNIRVWSNQLYRIKMGHESH
ncbi:MAG: hypothetical protein Ct9H90mP16_09400 [Candidatus Poseidoniales archaeon]|nr:MAG: hypothetical protein Ct9H90mP16_09400 [Candidatus Poseidoniales archaeon]